MALEKRLEKKHESLLLEVSKADAAVVNLLP